MQKNLAFLSGQNVLAFPRTKEAREHVRKAGFLRRRGQWISQVTEANAAKVKQTLIQAGFAVNEELYLYLSRLEGTIK